MAEKFQTKVADEIIPSIQKYGMYAQKELLDNLDLLISVVQELKEEREKSKKLLANIERMRIKEDYNKNAIEIGKGIEPSCIGRNKLFDIL